MDVCCRQAGSQAVSGDTGKIEGRHDDPRDEQRRDKDQGRRGQDPAGASRVEGTQLDPTGPLVLFDEQPRDEEAR